MHALQFAAYKHRFQKRKDPDETPYINHPIGVAHILSNEAEIKDLDLLSVGVHLFFFNKKIYSKKNKIYL